MNVAIVRPTAPPRDPVDVCIVVDVLRATTTATVLCDRIGELRVVRAIADLSALPARPYALFSELSGIDSDQPRFDNSPVQARTVELRERMPVLVTTNGTIAVGVAAQLAREVLLASFVNVTAVTDYVRGLGIATVAVMPAGNINKNQACIEDDGCAEALAARLRSEPFDVPATIAACRDDARIQRRLAKEPTLGADVDICFAHDSIPVVPRVVGTGDQGWFRVTR